MHSLAEAPPEDFFQLAVEAAPNAMVLVDSDGRLVLANAQVEQLFGYSRKELLGQPVEILVPGRFRAAHPDKRGRFFAAPQTRWIGAGGDLYGLRKDGVEVPIEIGLNAVKTAKGTCVLAAIIDVTERLRAEAAARHLAAVQHAATCVLAEAGSVQEAIARILQTVCEQLNWVLGDLFVVDRVAGVLRCLHTWHAPHVAVGEFAALTGKGVFSPGAGLPGARLGESGPGVGF